MTVITLDGGVKDIPDNSAYYKELVSKPVKSDWYSFRDSKDILHRVKRGSHWTERRAYAMAQEKKRIKALKG